MVHYEKFRSCITFGVDSRAWVADQQPETNTCTIILSVLMKSWPRRKIVFPSKVPSSTVAELGVIVIKSV